MTTATPSSAAVAAAPASADRPTQAPLLWPEDAATSPTPPAEWQSAESDFPESALWAHSIDFKAFAHYGGQGALDSFDVATALQAQQPLFDPNAWHVYTQTWGPGSRSYYVDGYLVGTSVYEVYSQPERWQLQIEPTTSTAVDPPGSAGSATSTSNGCGSALAAEPRTSPI